MNWQTIPRPALLAGALLAVTLTLVSAAPQTEQRTFATPRDAIQAVIDAAEHNDTAAMLKLSGRRARTSWKPATTPARATTARNSCAVPTRNWR